MSFALAHHTKSAADSKKSTSLYSSNAIHDLKQATGGHAVQRLIPLNNVGFDFANVHIFQSDLEVNEPEDAYIQEANRVIEQVTMYQPGVQRNCACGAGCPTCKSREKQRHARLQMRRIGSDELGRTKLMLGHPNDKFEREADQIADAIMFPRASQERAHEPFIQSRLAYPNNVIDRQPMEEIFILPEEEEEDEKAEKIQRKKASSGTLDITSMMDEDIKGLRDGGTPLPKMLRTFFESRFGYDFAQVRIHSDSLADRATRKLHARAFTWGNQIAFRAQEYTPDQTTDQHLLAHELTHVIQQGTAPQKKSGYGTVVPTLKTEAPILQGKDCNFYVYDSTEPTIIGTAWKKAAWLASLKSYGGYRVGSGKTIVTMLNGILEAFSEEECDCIEEIQFWSHGSSGNAMWISGTGEEITATDFDIPGLDKYGGVPHWLEQGPAWEPKRKWFNGLNPRQQLLLKVRDYICGPHAEIYYRSCEAFKGKKGKEFAKKSANFWRSWVTGHTEAIALDQPGQEWVRPGTEPGWSESEEGEMKKTWARKKGKKEERKKEFMKGE